MSIVDGFQLSDGELAGSLKLSRRLSTLTRQVFHEMELVFVEFRDSVSGRQISGHQMDVRIRLSSVMSCCVLASVVRRFSIERLACMTVV